MPCMWKILIFTIFIALKSHPALCSYYDGFRDDSLSHYYSLYDSLTADSTTNRNLFRRALLEFDGQLWLNRMNLVQQDRNDSFYRNSLRLRGDYYYALGSYLTAWNFYSRYLDIEFDRDIYSKMCKAVLIAARYREHDSIVEHWKSSAGEALTAYQNGLRLYKQENFKDALAHVEKSAGLFAGMHSRHIGDYLNFFSLKAELLRLNARDREAAVLVRDLAERFPNSVEMSRWADLYPFVRSMMQTQASSTPATAAPARPTPPPPPRAPAPASPQPQAPAATRQPTPAQEAPRQQQVARGAQKKVYYTYQLGSFREAENARRFLAVLRQKYPAQPFYVRPPSATRRDFYVVTISKYETEARARSRFENFYRKNIKEDMVFIRIYE